MALQKVIKEAEYNLDLNYWRVLSYSYNRVTQKATILLGGYVDSESANGMTTRPISTQSFEIDFDGTMSDLDSVKAVYNMVKTQETFTDAEDV